METASIPAAPSEYDRQPPYSLEAEFSVLGGMLFDTDAVARAVEVVAESMFYRAATRRLIRAMVESAGGAPYLAELLDAVPTAANIDYHARIVRDKALLRRLIDAASDIIRDVHDQGERSVEQVMDQAEQRVFRVAESHDRQGFVWIKEILWPTFEHIERLQESAGGITGVPTGFKDLDRMTTGFQKGDLIIVAGRPSMERPPGY